MSYRRKHIVLYGLICLECCRRWGATRVAMDRPCPFCGSERVTTIKERP